MYLVNVMHTSSSHNLTERSAKYHFSLRIKYFKFTINVPVVYMARDVMILMRENPFRGPLEGVGPENRDFFGP